MSATIHVGDCRAVMREMPARSVQAIVTSPPYWNLRDYGVAGQIGLEETVDAWVDSLVDTFREARRVLADDGVAWINLGDSYAGSRGSSAPSEASTLRGNGHVGGGPKLRAMTASRRRDDAPIPRSDLRVPGLKPKDCVGQPWRIAFALQADGWWWRDTIVWHKANPMPESVRDRCTKAWEPVLMMTKSARYYFDAEAISEAASEGTHARYAAAAGRPFGMSNWARGKGAHDAVSYSRNRKVALNGSGTKNNASFDAAMAVMPERRNKRNVWTIASEPFAELDGQKDAVIEQRATALATITISRQTAMQAFEHDRENFLRAMEKYEAVPYSKTPMLAAAFAQELKAAGQRAIDESRDPSAQELFEEAHAKVLEQMRALGMTVGAKKPKKEDGDAGESGSSAKDVGGKPARQVPRTLGGLPAAAPSGGIGDDLLQQAANLEGEDLELFVARLPEDKRRALESAG